MMGKDRVLPKKLWRFSIDAGTYMEWKGRGVKGGREGALQIS